MNRFRKAISVGVTATLLASLMATVAAPAAFAAVSTSGGGTITPGGAASPAGTLTFAEDGPDPTWNNFDNGSFDVEVQDSAGGAFVTWDTGSVPTVTRNSGVGSATAAFVGGELRITLADVDDTKLDSFTIGNLKVEADIDAPDGAVIFNVNDDGVGIPETLATASGETDGDFTAIATSILVTLNDGSPDFMVTDDPCDPSAVGKAGKATVAASGAAVVESVTVTGTDGSTYLDGVFLVTKPDGVAVTQTVCAARFPSFVTVGDAVDVTVGTVPNMQAGLNSQDGANVVVQLGFFDELLLDGDVITFTIATAGVLFSPDSCVTDCVTSGDIDLGTPTLGAGRTTISVAIDEDAAAGNIVEFDPNYDVASSVATGTRIDVNVTVSRAGVTVLGNPATVGVVGYVVAGSTAAPTVLIGQNDQSTGMITLRESVAGSMGDGNASDSDLIEVCLQEDQYGEMSDFWSVGRYFWAVVTTGDLKLNVAGLPASQGKMTIDDECLWINIYTESTVASTVEIRNGSSTAPDASGPTNGPKINVPVLNDDGDPVLPGQVYVDVWVDGGLVGDNIVIAIRAYTGTPIVSVSSQPNVVRGGVEQPIGNIIISEGFPNQFGGLNEFQICLVGQSGLYNPGAYSFSSQIGINQPLVTTNSTVSGLIAYIDATDPDVGGCFDINVDDTSIGGLGVITISNLKLDVMADAPLGSVFVRVFDGDDIVCSFDEENTPCFPNPVLVNQVVSPAKVGNPVAGAAATRLGVTQIGAFTISTKVAATGKYVTYRFDFGVAAAGKTFQVWGATKTGNDWSAFTVVTSRVANASGVVYYYIRSNSATWKSYRAYWSGGAVWTPARQARWIG